MPLIALEVLLLRTYRFSMHGERENQELGKEGNIAAPPERRSHNALVAGTYMPLCDARRNQVDERQMVAADRLANDRSAVGGHIAKVGDHGVGRGTGDTLPKIMKDRIDGVAALGGGGQSLGVEFAAALETLKHQVFAIDHIVIERCPSDTDSLSRILELQPQLGALLAGVGLGSMGLTALIPGVNIVGATVGSLLTALGVFEAINGALNSAVDDRSGFP